MRTVLAAALLALLIAAPALALDLEERWVYVSTNLLFEDNVDALTGLIADARDAGVTHIQLTDYQSGFMGDMPPRYFVNVARVKKAAADAGVIIAPSVFPLGSSSRYLYHNPNLAEGIPVRGMRFVVRGRDAVADPSLALDIPNAGFDDSDAGAPSGWTAVVEAPRRVTRDEADEGDSAAAAVAPPASSVIVDTAVKHSGAGSLRVSGPADGSVGGRAGATCRVPVKPFHAYTLTVWMKTENVRPERHPVQVLGARDGRALCFAYFMTDPAASWPPSDISASPVAIPGAPAGWAGGYTDFGLKPSGDWAQYKVAFNSLDYDEIDLFAGLSRAAGTIWFDDIEIRPAGLLNVLRRDLTPLVVTSGDGKTTYAEGLDFRYVDDPMLGRAPSRGDFMAVSRGTYGFWHDAPSLRLTPESRIKDGDTLLVSFYSPGIIYVKQQVTCSLSDPAVLELMDREMRWVARVWDSPCIFMNYDEIRCGGWEPQPGATDYSPGELLARHVARAVEIVRKHSPDARVYLWSDMFDPYHNARTLDEEGYYFLVNGSWYGSWEGLPSDVIIYKWGSNRPIRDSVRFFGDRGHRMVLSGAPVDKWLDETAGLPGIIGFSYTTWTGDYSGMRTFFESIKDWQPKGQAH